MSDDIIALTFKPSGSWWDRFCSALSIAWSNYRQRRVEETPADEYWESLERLLEKHETRN